MSNFFINFVLEKMRDIILILRVFINLFINHALNLGELPSGRRVGALKHYLIMSLFYRLRRDNRIDSDNLYYAVAVQTGEMDTSKLADIIQRNCSMKKSDVLAVLTELVEVMNDQLQNSMTVKLDGFGTFKLGVKSTGAESEEKFSVTKNITGLRCKFLAEGKKSADTGRVVRQFLGGCTLQKWEDPSLTKTKKA